MAAALSILALLYSGAVQAFISPPANLIWLHPTAWVPAFWVFRRLQGRRAVTAGWLVGTTANLAIFYWLAPTVSMFGGLPTAVGIGVWAAFAAATGFYTGVFAWGFGRIRRAGGASWPFAAAAWFCALEFFNPQLFAYLQGVAWYQVPEIFLVASVTGTSGVSFLVMSCNGVLVQWLEELTNDAPNRRAAVVNTGVLAVAAAAAVAVSAYRLERIEAAEARSEPLELALIQPNHSDARRAELRAAAPDAFALDLIAQSTRVLDENEGIEVLVWPEGALRSGPNSERNRAVPIFARNRGVEIWTGANHYAWLANGETESHNSAFRIREDGTVDSRYDKNILVPFGEYVPLRDTIPGFDRIPSLGNFTAGTTSPVYAAGKARFVFLICYEVIRSSFVRRVATPEVDLLVNVTVDHWYGDSSEQSQHLMLAAIQSALHGVPLVRATTTGISAIVDARGMMTAQTGKFVSETIVATVRPVRIPSVYSRFGDWFAWMCAIASLALLSVSRSSKRAK